MISTLSMVTMIVEAVFEDLYDNRFSLLETGSGRRIQCFGRTVRRRSTGAAQRSLGVAATTRNVFSSW